MRLQRAENATSLPGDFTVFGNGSLQLYLGERGALRKAVPLSDLAALQAAIVEWLGQLKLPANLRLSVDIDPQSFY